MQGRCVGQTGSIPRSVDFRHRRTPLIIIDLESGVFARRTLPSEFDSVRVHAFGSPALINIWSGDYASAFPAGVTVAGSWDKRLAYLRGQAMGEEFRDKGIDVQLGPVAGPLGKYPEGGRNWEGFAPDPSLTGFLFAETIKGIQDAGVIACAKHYILNEEEHFRQVPEAHGYGYNISNTLSSNIDDKTMHELYLW